MGYTSNAMANISCRIEVMYDFFFGDIISTFA